MCKLLFLSGAVMLGETGNWQIWIVLPQSFASLAMPLAGSKPPTQNDQIEDENEGQIKEK